MPRKRYTAEQIIGLLRQAEVELAKGRTVGVYAVSAYETELGYLLEEGFGLIAVTKERR